MTKPRVIVTRRWPSECQRRLSELFDVVLNEDDRPFSQADLASAMTACDALCPTVTDKLDEEVMSVSERRAKLVSNFGVGFNHIDIETAKQQGIVVTNTPHVLTDCTADIAMALMLAVARRIGEGERLVRNKEWNGWHPTHMMGTKVTGKKLGLVGFGRIAQAMAKKARFGFGMEIYFFDPSPIDTETMASVNASRCESLEALLEVSDFVSLHCPGGAATHHLIDANAFNRMQTHAYLINTARGDVVDQSALIDALNAGQIAGAGLDVYESEPNVPSELCELENVVLLPHLGSASHESRTAMGNRVIDNLIAFFDGDVPPDVVC